MRALANDFSDLPGDDLQDKVLNVLAYDPYTIRILRGSCFAVLFCLSPSKAVGFIAPVFVVPVFCVAARNTEALRRLAWIYVALALYIAVCAAMISEFRFQKRAHGVFDLQRRPDHRSNPFAWLGRTES